MTKINNFFQEEQQKNKNYKITVTNPEGKVIYNYNKEDDLKKSYDMMFTEDLHKAQTLKITASPEQATIIKNISEKIADKTYKDQDFIFSAYKINIIEGLSNIFLLQKTPKNQNSINLELQEESYKIATINDEGNFKDLTSIDKKNVNQWLKNFNNKNLLPNEALEVDDFTPLQQEKTKKPTIKISKPIKGGLNIAEENNDINLNEEGKNKENSQLETSKQNITERDDIGNLSFTANEIEQIKNYLQNNQTESNKKGLNVDELLYGDDSQDSAKNIDYSNIEKLFTNDNNAKKISPFNLLKIDNIIKNNDIINELMEEFSIDNATNVSSFTVKDLNLDNVVILKIEKKDAIYYEIAKRVEEYDNNIDFSFSPDYTKKNVNIKYDFDFTNDEKILIKDYFNRHKTKNNLDISLEDVDGDKIINPDELNNSQLSTTSTDEDKNTPINIAENFAKDVEEETKNYVINQDKNIKKLKNPLSLDEINLEVNTEPETILLYKKELKNNNLAINSTIINQFINFLAIPTENNDKNKGSKYDVDKSLPVQPKSYKNITEICNNQGEINRQKMNDGDYIKFKFMEKDRYIKNYNSKAFIEKQTIINSNKSLQDAIDWINSADKNNSNNDYIIDHSATIYKLLYQINEIGLLFNKPQTASNNYKNKEKTEEINHKEQLQEPEERGVYHLQNNNSENQIQELAEEKEIFSFDAENKKKSLEFISKTIPDNANKIKLLYDFKPGLSFESAFIRQLIKNNQAIKSNMNEFFNTHLNGNYSFKEGCKIKIIKNKQQNEASNENKEVDKKNISIEENTMKNYVKNAKELCEVSLITRPLNYIKNTIYTKLKDSLDKYRGN